jgi:hypothetical protein
MMAGRLARLVRVVTLPETRRLLVATAHSETLREIRERGVHDRGALLRDLRSPGKARDLLRSAVRHPAARELANAGLMLMPLRYLPAGWAATWVAHRVGRHLDLPGDVPRESSFAATRTPKNVTPAVPDA